jgi:hypothetical protein
MGRLGFRCGRRCSSGGLPHTLRRSGGFVGGQHLNEFLGGFLDAVIGITDVERDGFHVAQIAYVLIDLGERGVGGPLVALGDCPEDVTERLSILLATSGESTNRSKSRVTKRLSARLTNSSRNENKQNIAVDCG